MADRDRQVPKAPTDYGVTRSCRVGWQPDDLPCVCVDGRGRAGRGGPVTALIWFAAGFAVAMLLRARVSSRTETKAPPAAAPPRTRTRTSTGTGRAVLRTMRTVNDVRALSRGPGAYGRRLLRRQAFRSLRKW